MSVSRRIAASVAVATALVLPWSISRADDDDFKWDRTKMQAWKAGDTFVESKTDTVEYKKEVMCEANTDSGAFFPREEVSAEVFDRDPSPVSCDMNVNRSIALHEVKAVENGKIAEEVVRVQDYDGCGPESYDRPAFKGATFTFKGFEPSRTFEVNECPACPDGKPTKAAKKWLAATLKAELLRDQILEALMPSGPIVAGKEWPIDPTPLSKLCFNGVEMTDFHGGACRGKGKLDNVRTKDALRNVKDGVHVGRLTAELQGKLKKSPETGTAFFKGSDSSDDRQGAFWVSVDGDVALEGLPWRDLGVTFGYDGHTDLEDVKMASGKVEKHNVGTRYSVSIHWSVLPPEGK